MPAKITEKQRRFVEAYMGEAAGNATEAARLAGYRGNAKTLGVVGAENLAKPSIRAAIDARIDADPVVATREERQRFWSHVMRGDGEFAFLEMKDRLKASELLGRSQADFVDKHEHSGPGGTPIVPPEQPDLSLLSTGEVFMLRELTRKATKA